MNYLTYIIIGLLSGISMGAIGIGAGMISMPLLILSGLSLNKAVAITMVMQLLPQSIPGVINYWKDIIWIYALLVVFGSILGVYLGSYLTTNKILKEKLLYKILCIFLLLSTCYFFYNYWNKT